jgi:2-desacetyl-2-hydroxyethyl bacteriochlorophyllide A dehydrogenase
MKMGHTQNGKIQLKGSSNMKNETMKALVYEGPREMNVRELPVPSPVPDEVLIRVVKAGICGSELSGYLGHNSLRKPPLVMGHEFAGTVVATGSTVTAFRAGDRVTANPLVTCGRCLDCLDGRTNLCSERLLIGAGRPGAYAEYVTAPERNVRLLTNRMSFAAGAMVEPYACAARIVRLAALSPTDAVLIAGAGPIGLLTLRAARRCGVRDVAVMDLNADRLAIVRELGGIPVESKEALDRLRPTRGFDKTIDAVGIDATRQQCVTYARPGARVVLSGLHAAESVVPVNVAIRNELTLLGSFGYNPVDFDTAFRWIDEDGAGIDRWTEEAPLKNGKACFEKLLTQPGATAKILLTI